MLSVGLDQAAWMRSPWPFAGAAVFAKKSVNRVRKYAAQLGSAVGVRWFEFCCAGKGVAPHAEYAAILARRFRGTLKPPFNLEARAAAGMGAGYLEPWL